MSPTPSFDDVLNSAKSASELFSDSSAAHSRAESAHFEHLLFRESGLPASTSDSSVSMLVSENFRAMQDILRASHPFQIFRTVVLLVPILMIWLKTCGNRAIKSCCDHLMNQATMLLAVFSQNLLSVLRIPSDGGFKNLAIPCVADKSSIAHFVQTFIAYNWFPRLHRLGILA